MADTDASSASGSFKKAGRSKHAKLLFLCSAAGYEVLSIPPSRKFPPELSHCPMS